MTDLLHPTLTDLAASARQAMLDHGLEPDIPPDALREVAEIAGQPRTTIRLSAICAICRGRRSTTTTRATSTS